MSHPLKITIRPNENGLTLGRDCEVTVDGKKVRDVFGVTIDPIVPNRPVKATITVACEVDVELYEGVTILNVKG